MRWPVTLIAVWGTPEHKNSGIVWKAQLKAELTMAIRKIARMGHPILKQISKEVPDPTAPDVARLVSSMIETMNDAEGIGLAAPQVHMPWRIVVYKVMADRIGGEVSPQIKNQGVPTTVLINPVIEPIGDETDVSFEACLSVPGMAGPVERSPRG